MDVIRFYSVNDAYEELSNFAHYPIVLGGKGRPPSSTSRPRSFRR